MNSSTVFLFFLKRRAISSILQAYSLFSFFLCVIMYGELIPVGGGDPIPLRKTELLIGRHEGCDIVLRFSNVSSQHCKLVLSNGYWYVLDQRSTNGVKVNGVRVSDHRVDPGQTLHISKHAYRLQYSPTRNGATGPPPSEVFQEEDVISRSLLEKAGLQRASPSPRDVGSTIVDQPILDVVPQAVRTTTGPRDFFAELTFD